MSSSITSRLPVVTAERFVGKTAIVTGGSRGIGLAVAERLVAEGANVVITGRRPESLDAALASIDHGGRLHGVAGHAADADHQAQTVAVAMTRFGAVDLLVNNAAVNPVYGDLVGLDAAAAQKTFDVNCMTVLSWTQQAYRAHMGEYGGAIVNVSAVAAFRAARGIAFYGATKALINSLTASLAVELGPTVRVNAVAPAVVKTDFARLLYEGQEERIAAAYPLQRLGTSADVAGPVSYLLSEDASWITGQTLVVDGGLTLEAAGQ
ncbi:SDR family oxidoreductase [Nocardioides albidus]|uniref:SDR family oxidoreductase n=1 Tax=Nocardioides albidus TaxID=1517589 RepID=A0A5C4VRG5_9ACTN|nr:SDR family oxidoreductase [Nocardioides albidus]TNM38474.1 SDR family oxidoreductase [Nocardioides albidus]